VKKNARRRNASVSCQAPAWFDDVVESRQLTGAPLPRGEQLRDDGPLAAGGYAEVHRAFDQNLLRSVAMKVLHPRHLERQSARLRFLEEAQITGQLDHPNIVPIHEMGVDGQGQHFFTMKLVEGDTLTDILDRADLAAAPRRELYSILQIVLRVCDALSFAHNKGVIHRDLKPDNIMVGSHGQVYVMDWGIARLQEGVRPSEKDASAVRIKRERVDAPGTIIGTPAFMAPEQAQGRVEDIDARTDVFSLGAILYVILTGRPPYVGEDVSRKLKAAQRGVIKPPAEVVPGRTLPARLCDITMRALATLPKDRFQTVQELKAELEGFLRGGWWFSQRVFKKGTLIVKEGAEADAAYIITDGQCEVFHTRRGRKDVMREMGPGQVFGETAIFSARPRTASVRAVTDVTAMVVTRQSLEEELGKDGWMGHFVRALADRFADLDQRLENAVAPARKKKPRG
jgi:serine/threonine-protein kinase